MRYCSARLEGFWGRHGGLVVKVGIFGPKGAGKTTVFSSLTGISPQPHARGKPVLGTVKVPDERVDYLASVYHPRKVTFAEVVFADLPAAEESGLGASLAAELRNMDLLTLVVAAFPSPMAAGEPDPLRDFRAMETDLLLWDLAVVEKRLERLAKEGAKGPERNVLERCHEHLEREMPLRLMEWSEQDERLLRGYRLLTRKRLIVLVNTPEEQPAMDLRALEEQARERGASVLQLSAKVEAEIMELAPEERSEFLAELGETMTASERYVRHAYRELDLISFLTSGEDECRAWTIRRGTTARAAAGVIHSDIERGFIRAEVISFEDFKRFGSEERARAAGRYRLEGKDYVVQDGDIVAFRFNV